MRFFRCSLPSTQELREGFKFMNGAFTAVGGRKVVERFSPWLGLPSAEVSETNPSISSQYAIYLYALLLSLARPDKVLPIGIAVLVYTLDLPTLQNAASITRSCVGFISEHGFIGSAKELREGFNLVKGAFEGVTSRDIAEYCVAQLRS